MATLELVNLTKQWGSIIGVSESNLKIDDNEFIVILGPSGCGKTTTMRMIAGLEQPSSGEILIDGVTVNDLEPKDRDIAMVFQNYGLYPHLTVYENILFPLKVRKELENCDERVRQAAHRVELDELLERKPKELSGGQRQRVALARAIVRNPKIFLMDEPLSNLDAKLRVSTRAQLKNLQHELKTTTIYVTHDQIEAMTLANRVVVMNHGKIQQVATPKEIYNKPNNIFVAAFIGLPPMNILKGQVEKHKFSVADFVMDCPMVENGEVYIGFRAEDAELTENKALANLVADIFSIELLGESTMVSIKINGTLLSIKASKDYQAEIGEQVAVKIAPEYCHFFDGKTEQRLS